MRGVEGDEDMGAIFVGCVICGSGVRLFTAKRRGHGRCSSAWTVHRVGPGGRG